MSELWLQKPSNLSADVLLCHRLVFIAPLPVLEHDLSMPNLENTRSKVGESPLLRGFVDEPGSPEGSLEFVTDREGKTCFSLASRLAHADVDEVLPIGFGGAGSEGDVDG